MSDPAPDKKADGSKYVNESEIIDGAGTYNKGTRDHHLPNEIRNSFANWDILDKRHKAGIALGIQEAPKHKGPCIVIGSGYSTDRAMPLLKDWKGGIICSTSQAHACVYWGAHPDYILALDTDTTEQELVPWSLWKHKKTVFVSQPGMNSNLVEFWKGKSYWFRKLEPEVAFYFNEQNLAYSTKNRDGAWIPWIEVQFVMLASSAPALIFLAQYLGYSPIFMVGIEFGWMDNAHSRFTDWRFEKVEGAYKWKEDVADKPDGGHTYKWVEHPAQIEKMVQDDRTFQYALRAENGAYTNQFHLFYKRNFLCAWRLDRSQLWDAGHAGAISEIPQCEIEDVIARQGEGFPAYTEQDIIDRVEPYLARKNTYIVEYNHGIRFIEADKPDKQIPLMFGTFARGKVDDVDIVKNMKRINKARDISTTVEMELEYHKLFDQERTKESADNVMKQVYDLAESGKAAAEAVMCAQSGIVDQSLAALNGIIGILEPYRLSVRMGGV